MKRTLKNILAVVLLVLSLCAMVLTMVQIQKGISVFDWTTQKIDEILPHEQTDSSENSTPSTTDSDDQTQVSNDQGEEASDINSLPEPTAENPATAARVVKIYPIAAEEEPAADSSSDQETGDAADLTTDDDTGESADALDEDSSDAATLEDIAREEEQNYTPMEPMETEGTQPENTASQIVLYEKDSAGSVKILGMGWKDVVCFALESLLFALTLVYLFMSGFNKKTLGQTLKNFDKFLIWILCSLLVTALMTCGDIWLTRRFFMDASAKSSDQAPAQAQNQQPLDQQPPEGEQPPEMPDDKPDMKPDGKPGEPGSMPPGSDADINYDAETKIDNDTVLDYGDYASDTSDQNAIWVDGAAVTLSNANVEKTGSSDGGDTTSFYGTNSAVLATNGAELTMDGMSIDTDATGANGVFSYGTRDDIPTKVIISNSNITTSQDNSGGIMTTGGASMQATDLLINTYGRSSAAIRTDRGGGTVDVTGGTYTTYGPGSPAIYSTADITASKASLNSNASEGIVVEGHNSVTLNGCELVDSNTMLNGDSETYKNIFLYQSMSGDAEEGTSRFFADDSTITTNNGDTFYVTNTDAEISLQNNTISNKDPMGSFLRLEAAAWGNEGHNGAIVRMLLENQQVKGDIHVDGLSELYFNLENGSYYEGAINQESTGRKVQLTLTKDSSMKLTGDCYVDKVTNEDKAWDNIDYNGYTLYVNGKGWNEYNSK